MIIETFQTEQDYIKYVRNILIFTHLSCYNGHCNMWKDEDIQLISNLNNEQIRDNDPDLWRKSIDAYCKARESYGNIVSQYRDNFSSLTAENVLYAFGFEYNADCDEDIEHDLDIDLDTVAKTENYPKSFPVIAFLSDGDFKVEKVYPEDFDKSVEIEDFSWLEENVRAFWRGEKGSCWGA